MSRKRILVVEDDGDIREALRGVLESEGYAVRVAANGAEALAILQGEPLPSLALVDLMMPVMNGWQLLARMHADPRLGRLPVVVVSAATTPAAPDGATFLRKPFAIDRLLEEVARHCI